MNADACPIGPRQFVQRRFVVVFVAALALFAVLFVVATFWLASGRCRVAVQNRHDSRAMWLYLIEQHPDDDEEAAFVVELDRRLPELHCVNNRPVPISEEP